MIKEKIYELLSLNEDLPIPEEVFKEFTGNILYGLKRQIFRQREEKANLRLSQIGRCLRQQWYAIKGYEGEELNPRAKMTFLFGDIIEAVVVVLAKASGVNIIDQQKEVDVLGVKGHIDGIIKDGDNLYLFECKSMSDAGFKNLERYGLENDFGYLTQANMYMHALGLDKGYLVAVNKNTGHIAEVELKRDDKLVEETLNDIRAIRIHLENDTLPARKYELIAETYRKKETGRKILPVQCAYCSYKQHCWENLIQDFKGNKPIWVVEEEKNE